MTPTAYASSKNLAAGLCLLSIMLCGNPLPVWADPQAPLPDNDQQKSENVNDGRDDEDARADNDNNDDDSTRDAADNSSPRYTVDNASDIIAGIVANAQQTIAAAENDSDDDQVSDATDSTPSASPVLPSAVNPLYASASPPPLIRTGLTNYQGQNGNNPLPTHAPPPRYVDSRQSPSMLVYNSDADHHSQNGRNGNGGYRDAPWHANDHQPPGYGHRQEHYADARTGQAHVKNPDNHNAPNQTHQHPAQQQPVRHTDN